MKATGIVRRIDDLGRVVIPKGIRRTMHIREGDSLEIFTDRDGQVIFKKYSPIGEMGHLAALYAEALSRACGRPALVCDRDRVVAVAGGGKREFLDRDVSASLDALLDARRSFSRESGERALRPVENAEAEAVTVEPVIADGDVVGAVCLLATTDHPRPVDTDRKLAAVAAVLLGKQMEEG